MSPTPARAGAAAALLLAVGAALAACAPAADDAADSAGAAAPASDTAAGVATAGAPTLVGVVEGLRTPESVRYDADQDVFFVSNINGNPSQKDRNGFISRVHADSLQQPTLEWIRGGETGITLHAPKGMAIVGDTLWVADVDAVRGFNRRTGRPVGTVDLAGLGAVFLNDVAVGPGGALYVTDTGIRFAGDGTMTAPGPNRIFRIAGRTPEVMVEDSILAAPNGITWDSAGGRFLVAPFSGPSILGIPSDGAMRPRHLAAGPGGYDGIELLADRRAVVTTWSDSSVYLMTDDSTLTRLITGLEAPADLGVDRRRSRLLLPLFNQNRVVVYEVR